MIHALRWLAKLKFLRGTVFDPFGSTAERRTERRLITDYLAMVQQHLPALTPEMLPLLIRLARVPETIRGYGHIKDSSITKALAEKARLEAELENIRFAAAAE
jgi:indolepyruvate ferredoxin oxidoreductase